MVDDEVRQRVMALKSGAPADFTSQPESPAAAAEQPGSRPWVATSVLGALLVVEALRDGGFWRPDAVVVAVAASVILVAALLRGQPADRDGRVITGALVALAGWWLLRSVGVGTPTTFLPLGASILGFTAAFVTVRQLGGRQRALVGEAIAGLGAMLALLGFAGLTMRWFPLAMPAQHLWRLSTTLTYSDAAGLALAMALLVALGADRPSWWARASVCLCLGGVLAAQSRGALIALAVAAAVVPLRQYRSFAVPLAAGLVLGITAVGTSGSPHRVVWLGVVLLGAVATAVTGRPEGRMRLSRGHVVALGVVAAIVVMACAVALHHEIALRALAPSDQDRTVEWAAAIHQFWASPWIGVGPDHLLHFVATDGTTAHFAHNEYLQVLADGGIVGAALVVLGGVGLVRTIRRTDVMSACAAAGLLCWAVGGAFDFDWHLPFIGLLGGCVAGLTATRTTWTRRTT